MVTRFFVVVLSCHSDGVATLLFVACTLQKDFHRLKISQDCMARALQLLEAVGQDVVALVSKFLNPKQLLYMPAQQFATVRGVQCRVVLERARFRNLSRDCVLCEASRAELAAGVLCCSCPRSVSRCCVAGCTI